MGKTAAADVKTEVYVPKFKKPYELLLNVYSEAMKSSDDSLLLCERAKAIFMAWNVLRKAGVLPEIFVKDFAHDIDQVMISVNKNLKPRELKNHQSYLSFGIANLRNAFCR
ncbi:MAG: hypothetical protein V3T98_01385 [Candidatus Paceibacterota bacterium]